MAIYSVDSGCRICGACEYVCPASAIYMDASGAVIDSTSCIGCGTCAMQCPSNAIKRID